MICLNIHNELQLICKTNLLRISGQPNPGACMEEEIHKDNKLGHHMKS